MHHLLLLVAVTSLVAGCKDSKPSSKPQEPEKSAAVADPRWVERLAEASEPAKLSLATAAGLVGITADGSLHVGSPPAAGAAPLADAKPVKLEQLVSALGIAPVVRRDDDALATLEASGSGATEDPFARLAHPSRASGAPTPARRATSVFATAHPHEVTTGVVVFAEARAPAALLIDVITQTGGFLAVRQGQELGALPLSFDRQGPPAIAPDKSWIEVRLGKTIDIESVPSQATAVESSDKLGAALNDAPAVDVLVGPETTVQDLVTAIGALRGAKVAAFGFGRAPAPGSPDAAARGEQGPRVIAWDFHTRGQGDVAAIRAALDAALEPMRTCYSKALAKKKDLGGAAQLQWLVTEKAGVSNLQVDAAPALAPCVTGAVKAAKYPPTGVAGVVVDARISFLPASAKL